MERNREERNRMGAFLGGMLGIMACAWLHWFFLPFGCVIGALVGYKFEEIVDSGCVAAKRGIDITREFFSPLSSIRITFRIELNLPPIAPVFAALFGVLCIICKPIDWLLGRPFAFVKWYRRHPVNQAWTLSVLASFASIAVNALWLLPFDLWVFAAFSPTDPNSARPLLLIPAMLVNALVVLPALMWPSLLERDIPNLAFPNVLRSFRREETDLATLGKMHQHYLLHSRIVRGKFNFFVWALKNCFILELTMFVVIASGLIWYVTAGGLFVLFIVAPISFAVGIVKGFYKAATEKEVWLCAGITTTVSIVTATLTYHLFTQPALVALVAFVNGCTCSLVANAVSHRLIPFIDQQELGFRILSQPLGALLSPYGAKFVRVTNVMENGLSRLWPAPLTW